MIRLILGFLGSQASGEIVALYVGHSGVDAQRAVDAAQGFPGGVHIAEIPHTRRARRSPGLPQVSEGESSLALPIEVNVRELEETKALFEEASKELQEKDKQIADLFARFESEQAKAAALAKERDALNKQIAKLERACSVKAVKPPEAEAPPAAPTEAPASPDSKLSDDEPEGNAAPGAPAI
jgi:peptidoglycan hydrolase CwlO-like protein